MNEQIEVLHLLQVIILSFVFSRIIQIYIPVNNVIFFFFFDDFFMFINSAPG